MQRGRKPSNLLPFPTDQAPAPIDPPGGLNTEERALFEQLVSTTEARHLRPSDAPMLVSYVQATLMARRLAHAGDIKEFDRAARLQATLATKLRLTPHSRFDPITIGRMQGPQPSAYDLRKHDHDGRN